MYILKKKSIFPLIILFILSLVLHSFYNFGIDDNYFATYFNQLFVLNNSNFLIMRFNTWSSRIFIEFFLSILAKFPVIWMVLDSVIITIISVLIPNLLIPNFKSLKDNKKKLYYLISCCLTLLFLYVNFVSFITPGFIASTLNYIWPFSFGLINLYLLKEYILTNNVQVHLKKIIFYLLFIFSFIFAINMEIMSVVLFLVYLCLILMLIKKNNSNLINKLNNVPKIMYIFLVLSFLFILIHLKCPGNNVRFATETSRWLGEYLSISVLNKIDIGFTSVFYIMLTRFDFIMVYLLFAILGVYVSIISRKKIISLIASYPFLIMSLIYLIRLWDDKSNLLFINIITNAFRPSTQAAFHGLLANGFSLPVILILFVYLTIIISILLSIIFIIKYRNKNIGIQILILLILSFISQFVSGNAPSSIMVYPQYPGRYWIIFNGILMFPIGLMIYDILENWKISIKKISKFN